MRKVIEDNDSDSDLPEWLSQQAEETDKVVYDLIGDDSSDDEPLVNRLASRPGEEPASIAPTQQEEEPSDTEAGPSKATTAGKTAAKPETALSQGTQSQEPAAGSQPPKPAVGLAEGIPGHLPLVFPEKISRVKLLVELEQGEDGSTDLTGDAGAVGRFLCTGPAGQKEIKLDLKGILYSAQIVPSAATICLVNVGQADARIEAVMSEFVQLRPESNYNQCETTQGSLDGYFGADDDEDNYQAQAGDPAQPGAEGGPAGKGKSGKGTKARGGATTGKAGRGTGRGGASAAKPRKPGVRGGVKKPKAKKSAGRGKGKS